MAQTDATGFYAILVPNGGPYTVKLFDASNQLVDSKQVKAAANKGLVLVNFGGAAK